IFFSAREGRTFTARQALRLVRLRLLTLVRVCARLTVIGLIAFLPLLAVSAGFALWLLPWHDINYYLKVPRLWTFCWRRVRRARIFELVHSNGFNSPSMVGINSVTVG